MRWEDEHYVKLYTRDSATWLMMPWQSRALLPLLMRKVDAAGLLPLGPDHISALSALTGTPCDFVSPGFEGLQKFGVISMHGNVLEVPNYVAAQEARKTVQLRKRDERERAKAAARAELILQPTEITQTDVTRRHTKSRGVTRRHSPTSSPTPSSSSSSNLASEREEAAPLAEESPPPLKSPRAAKPKAPRRQLSDSLCADFEELRGAKYGWQDAKDGQALTRLMKKGPDEEVRARWRKGLKNPPGFLRVSSVAELDSKWNHLTGDTGPPGRVVDFRKAPVRAEDIPPETWDVVGDVTDSF